MVQLERQIAAHTKHVVYLQRQAALQSKPRGDRAQLQRLARKAKGVKLGAASKNKESMHTAMNKVNTTMSALAEHAGGQTRRGPKPKHK